MTADADVDVDLDDDDEMYHCRSMVYGNKGVRRYRGAGSGMN